MRKPLVGHHLMRVRVRKAVFEKLNEAAQEESVRVGENITVSDLVRAACYDLLLKHEALKRLENLPEDFWASTTEGVSITFAVML